MSIYQQYFSSWKPSYSVDSQNMNLNNLVPLEPQPQPQPQPVLKSVKKPKKSVKKTTSQKYSCEKNKCTQNDTGKFDSLESCKEKGCESDSNILNYVALAFILASLILATSSLFMGNKNKKK